MAQNKYVDLTGLTHYDSKIKTYIDEKDSTSLASAKSYADSLADNYDAAGVAETKVNALANGQVKTNTEAIAKLNGDATTDGSVAKSIADAKTEIEADISAVESKATAAQSSATAAQADVDALEAKVGTVPDGSTVMGIITNIQENAYDDTAIKALIQTNANDIDALETRATAVEGKVTTLIGSDTDKSVRTIANEELATQLIPENAKESLDTLSEIAAWIQAHPDNASAMNQSIESLKTLVGTIPEGVTSTTISAYIQEAVNAEETRAEGAESGLDTRLNAVETKLGDGTGSVTEQISTAKSEAISEATATAASDATTKANQALADAKSYTDTEIGKTNTNVTTNTNDISSLKTRMATAESDIDELQAAIADGGSVTTAIAEVKKAGTDAQADVDALETTVSTLSGKVTTNETNISAHADRLTALETKVGDGFVAITNAEIDALFTSAT